MPTRQKAASGRYTSEKIDLEVEEQSYFWPI
jgi:hypothetical protein